MATRIPAKQLQTYGTLAELKDRLLETETGWCTDDNILYYNNGGTLTPVTKVVVIKENTSRADIAAVISAGCVPVVKLDLQGTVYLYPVHIRGNDAYAFASPISIGSGNTKDGYYWATVAANGTWSTGFKEIEVTVEEEVLKILVPNPVDDKVSDDDYQAIGTHKMAVMVYGSGTNSVATLASIGSGGATFVSINAATEKLIVFDVAPNAVNNKHAVTRTEIPISGGGGDCNAVLFECTELGGTFSGPSFDDLEAARAGGKIIALLVHTGRDTVQDSYFVFDYYGSGRGTFRYNFVNLDDRDMLVFGGRTGDATSYAWSHETAIFAPGDALEFGSDRVLNVQAGEGLEVNSETNALDVVIDPNSLEIIDGVITIKKEIVDVTDEMVELLDDMDRKITSTFPAAHIHNIYDFRGNGYANGNAMIAQMFLCPVAQEIRIDGDCPTHITVHTGDQAYGGHVCFAIFEYDPAANSGKGSTYWLCETGPVKLKVGTNHFPIRFMKATTPDRPKIKLESNKVYYAVITFRSSQVSGEPANGLWLAGGEPYVTQFNNANPAVSMGNENMLEGTPGDVPTVDWSGDNPVLQYTWFTRAQNSEPYTVPRLFMLISNRAPSSDPGPGPGPGPGPTPTDPFPDYSDSYTLDHTDEVGDKFNNTSYNNPVIMQRVTPDANITVHKIAYVDTRSEAGYWSQWYHPDNVPLIMNGTSYAAERTYASASLTSDGTTIDGTHYIHEYTLSQDFEMVAGTSYWVAAMLGFDSPMANAPIAQYSAPADAATKDLLLVGDFYNPAQTSSHELVNNAAKTVCILEDVDGNRYMF